MIKRRTTKVQNSHTKPTRIHRLIPAATCQTETQTKSSKLNLSQMLHIYLADNFWWGYKYLKHYATSFFIKLQGPNTFPNFFTATVNHNINRWCQMQELLIPWILWRGSWDDEERLRDIRWKRQNEWNDIQNPFLQKIGTIQNHCTKNYAVPYHHRMVLKWSLVRLQRSEQPLTSDIWFLSSFKTNK